jgi:hypothetical protein
MKHQQRKLESGDDDDDEENNIKLNISDQSFTLDNLDVHPIGEPPAINLFPELEEIEVLD